MSELPARSVLVVEDEPLLAWELEELLEANGYEVWGPYNDLAAVLDLLNKRMPELAVLDITVSGQKIFPAADCLKRARVPFVFLSGHAQQIIPGIHQDVALLNKPLRHADLMGLLARMGA